ncbi:hypothetical protein LAZ67_21001337 [Cordylochernes scorpioides]|uniref:Uncharacterized protein n=1 Tax=Cordylochernes scorpioides TaxID=51811 RepID=A0ABY6LPB5_9ARAC|nr:hypothetical protein LAZ67_21001337 [Cordylochernes scorpioides]
MVKILKLKIEIFCGEIGQWLNFWNAFDSSINRNEHLTKIGRFNYLKVYFSGTAAQTREGFCLYEENYDIRPCLKYGHVSKFCKVRANGNSCGELRYLRIMCPRKNLNEEIATSARGIIKGETLTNLTTTPVVLLPTMRSTVEEMGYECSKQESLRHSLFGRSNTELYEHRFYDIRDLTDLQKGPLEIPLGADIAGKLLTKEHIKLPSGACGGANKIGLDFNGQDSGHRKRN